MWTALALVVLAPVVAIAAGEGDSYRTWCARCHGDAGDGRGLAAASLAFGGRAPRDFTTGRFKIKTTRSGEGPTDPDLARTITRGLPGTSMPYFEDLLRPDEIRELVADVRRFARHPRPPGTPIELGTPPPDDAASRARGAQRYEDLGCWACHGEDGRGAGPSASALRNEDGTPSRVADLGRPWTFLGGAAAADVAMRVATGLEGTPMPGYVDVAEPRDLWDLAHFVVSLASAPSLEAAARAAATAPPGEGTSLVRRGRYLAAAGTCFLCHAQMNPDGSYAEGSFGAGGMPVTIDTLGRVFSRNLTPDAETGLGDWTPADLRRALREGRSREGRYLHALDMPWTILADLTDRDVDALHAYLRTLPAVPNPIPPPDAAGLLDGTLGKLRLAVTGELVGGGYHPGNAARLGGREAPGPTRNPSTEPVLLGTSGLSLLLVVLWGRRRGRVALVGVAATIVVGTIVYTWPPLRWLPPALVRGVAPWNGIAPLLALPPLRPPPEPVATGTPALDALAHRGRYVATIGTCPLCHTAGPSPTRPWTDYPEMGGGMRVSWRVFGTTYSRNLTPDRETGLGAWSPREVRRALVSGIARDGRQMHWQAMPWDHFSNFSPEDIEALITYLRHLPPVWSRVPTPEPPGPGDRAADTFFLGYDGELRR